MIFSIDTICVASLDHKLLACYYFAHRSIKNDYIHGMRSHSGKLSMSAVHDNDWCMVLLLHNYINTAFLFC